MTLRKKQGGMTAADFRRIALSLKGAEEGSHMGASTSASEVGPSRRSPTRRRATAT
jgi:hypothetical protein